MNAPRRELVVLVLRDAMREHGVHRTGWNAASSPW